jgi:hypothetical protein
MCVLTELLLCDISKFPKLFIFLKIFIVPRHSQFNAAFLFKKICNLQILSTFLNFVTFQMILFPQAFIVANTGKRCHIFENIRNILNFLYLQICENFIFLLNHSLTASYATLKTLNRFWNFLKFSK